MNTLQTPSQNAGSVVVKGCLYSKHHRHWYEDGNFGFLVEETAFLLHRSVLSRRSSVMADLFSLPQSSSLGNDGAANTSSSTLTIDGVPFVMLHDKAGDFANVLNLVYPNSVSTSASSSQSVIDLLGMTRFSGKYLFDDIKQWAISQLESNALLVPDKDGLRTALTDGLYSDPNHCARIILLSRECDLPQFLPLAFYALATADWGDTSVSKDPLSLDMLADEDRRRVQEGRIELNKEVIRMAYSMPENGCTEQRCPQRNPNCRQGRSTIWLDPVERWTQLLLHPLEELGFRLTESSGVLCTSCLGDLHRTTGEFRDNLLERLEDFFRL